ncbi:transglycosylase SLT domain-containing protein [Haliea salexigens]|uniref:transglycosylase SLT domain-containing protein n=1 Tax=Haliea salexigens TaxID=287487 RepID=UPI00041403BD|nr:transglycosylase SLT domain-containing protein [Haliea salexigens]
MKRLLPYLLLLLVPACATTPPGNVDNACSIFREKDGWYDDALAAQKAWGSPVPVMLAIMHQESRFVAQAKPPRTRILGIIPGFRPSNSYGYSQAIKSTWKAYERSTGHYGADRDDFGDSMDFIGWYNNESLHRSGIAKNDAYRLYLAYHEGHGGYNRGSYRDKGWLLRVATKVRDRAAQYTVQLNGCADSLPRGRGLFGWF